MASAATYIPNMLEAIREGTVPGAFTDDRTEFAFPVLSYTGARGATHTWTIRVRLLDEEGEYVPISDDLLDQPAPDLPGMKAEVVTETQQVGGKIRDSVPTYVSTGKNLGKRNATNQIGQAIRNAWGLYCKQKKRADIVVDSGPAPPPPAAGKPSRGPAKSAPAGAAKKASKQSSMPPSKSGAKKSVAEPVEDGTAEGDAAGDDGAAGDGSEAATKFDEMPPPMLVKKIGESREATLTPATFARGVTVQPKLNGVHYVAFARVGADGTKSLVRYSRTGTEYPGQEHVAAELLAMMATAPRMSPGEYGLPAGADGKGDRRVLAAYGALPGASGDPAPYFAGELYLHGKTLNWISGQARRGDDEGLLEFHVFDVFFPRAKAAGHDMKSADRQAYIDAFFAAADAAEVPHPHVRRVPNRLVDDPAAPGGRRQVRNMDELNALAKEFLAAGYEGAIARKDDGGYRYSYSNYHSAHLVKIKPVHDAEYPVVGFGQGTRGKDVGAVIWECEVPHPVDPRDRTFTVVPKDLTYEDRYALFECLGRVVPGPDGLPVTRFERDLKGLPLTVEYRELSAKTGKPLQAKALTFRTYESGPDADPVRKLLSECRAEADS